MFEVSDHQARDFALAISADIAEYIRLHRSEYELFLMQEARK